MAIDRACPCLREPGCWEKASPCPALVPEDAGGPGTAAGFRAWGWLCAEKLSLGGPALRSWLWTGPAVGGSRAAWGSLLLPYPGSRSLLQPGAHLWVQGRAVRDLSRRPCPHLAAHVFHGVIQDGRLMGNCISSRSRTQDSRRGGIERLGLK